MELRSVRNSYGYTNVNGFLFNDVTLKDIEVFKNFDDKGNAFAQISVVYNQCCRQSKEIPFETLNRSQLRSIMQICFEYYAYKELDIKKVYSNIYKINNCSFTDLDTYESMSLNKLRMLIEVHNQVQEENSPRNKNNGFTGIKPQNTQHTLL